MKASNKEVMQNEIHPIRIHTDRQTQQCLNCYPSKLSQKLK